MRTFSLLGISDWQVDFQLRDGNAILGPSVRKVPLVKELHESSGVKVIFSCHGKLPLLDTAHTASFLLGSCGIPKISQFQKSKFTSSLISSAA